MSLSELLGEIERRKTIIQTCFKDYDYHLKVKEFHKASEDLWGIVNNVLYSIGLLRGEKLSEHSKLLRFVNDLAVSKEDKDIVDGFVIAESLHANYYHNFMDEDMFNRNREKVEALIRKLEEILVEEIKDIGITP